MTERTNHILKHFRADNVPSSFISHDKRTIILSHVVECICTLKEQCHEEFAVLGQFWAKIITFSLNHKQNASVKLRGRSQMNFITEG